MTVCANEACDSVKQCKQETHDTFKFHDVIKKTYDMINKVLAVIYVRIKKVYWLLFS
jgi:ferredoxin